MSEKADYTKSSTTQRDGRFDLDPVYSAAVNSYELLTAEQERELAQTMELGREASDRIAQESDLLDPAELKHLEEAAKVGLGARERFIRANLRLVLSNANRYRNSGRSFEDLVQDGNAGLIHAVDMFDWRKGFKFSTYGTWWIRQSIMQGISDSGRAKNATVRMGEYFAVVYSAKDELYSELHRTPTPEEVSERSGVNINLASAILNHQDPISFSHLVSVEAGVDVELEKFIGDTEAVDPAESAARADEIEETRRFLKFAFNTGMFTDREIAILRLRYGFEGEEVMTRDDIGEHVGGLSRERVRQLEARALNKLRDLRGPFLESDHSRRAKMIA